MAKWYRSWYGTAVPIGHMDSMMAGMMGMHASATTEGKSADQAFLEMMIMHHHMGVMMASMALGAHQKPELAKLEQSIIVDQSREIAQMRTWQLAWYPVRA